MIWGNGVDETLDDEISVTVIATGFSTSSIPEMVAAKQPEKTYHTLVDNSVQKMPGTRLLTKEKNESEKYVEH